MRRTQLGLLLGSALSLLGAAPGAAQECLDCHGEAGSTVAFKDGSSKDITIDRGAWAASVHGAAGLGCADCHATHGEYPHPEPQARSARDYTLANYTTCQSCHEEQFKKQLDGVHLKVIAAGNKGAAVCSDCHDPHRQRKITGEDGRLLPEGRIGIPQTCARCHAEIQEKYRASVHGSALGDKNGDVPTCIDCHGVHDIEDPRTAAFRLASPRLCADCHTDASKMKKYGLSTQVLRTYVADFHGSTVTLFERTHPEQVTNKPVCYDCHGVHDIQSKKSPGKGLQVKANLLRTCQKCHPDASTNFPDAWLSHYVPARDRAPLVYWARLAYRILIPTVVGGMALFVASDFARRRLDRRRHLERRHRGDIA
jgi:formate-dependent nitrite reductase cytochrome c552 subunit